MSPALPLVLPPTTTTMSEKHEKQSQEDVVADNASLVSTDHDDRVLEEIGYIPSFKREFSNLATVRLSF